MTLAPQFSSLNYRLSTKHATTLSVIWLQSQISHNFYDNVFLLGKYFLRTNRQAFQPSALIIMVGMVAIFIIVWEENR